MSLISPALKGYMKLRWSVIDNFMLNPIDTQKQVFNDLIAQAQFTAFGKAHQFDKIDNIKDFQQKVPIHDYVGMKPYIERMLNGEQNVLWPSDIYWFAKSSGTTSDKSKFIPVSKESLDTNHYKAGKDTLALYLRQFPDSGITEGKCLVIGGSHQINQLNGESYYGDLSAVLMQNMPTAGSIMRAPELSIALMDEWEAKIEAIAQATIHENITYLAGVPTWMIVLIKRIFEITGKDDLHDVWPNLELYLHGGVSFKPYRKQFEQFFRKRSIKFLENYNASEGFFATQDDVYQEGMLLLLNHGIFYEFLPMDCIGQSDTNAVPITLDKVELNKNYALIISTNGGLWRYMVGDTVKFTSLNPFRILVSGRTKSFINAFGEEVIVDNSDMAIMKACEQTGAVVVDYTAAPVYMSSDNNGAHEWLIEFEQLPVALEVFTEALDTALKTINSDYEAKRHKNIALRMPIVHQMPIGGFQAWLKSKGKLGGQHKVPRLSNDRKLMDELLPFSQGK